MEYHALKNRLQMSGERENDLIKDLAESSKELVEVNNKLENALKVIEEAHFVVEATVEENYLRDGPLKSELQKRFERLLEVLSKK